MRDKLTDIKIQKIIHWIVGILALGFVGIHIAVLVRYGSIPAYFDHAEPNVAIRTWRLVNGAPIYESLSADNFFLTAYGPVLFLLDGIWLKLLGGFITASKMGGFVSSLAGLAFFALYVVRAHGRQWLPWAALIYGSFLLFANPFSFWVRPDPHIIMAVSLALLGTTFTRVWASVIWVAACIGLAINLKIHALVYFFPIFVRFCHSNWLRVWPVMALTTLICVGLPFLLPGVPLDAYVEEVFGVVKTREIVPAQLVQSMRYGLVFLSPLILLPVVFAAGRLQFLSKADRVYLVALIVTVGLLLYPSSVPGTFWYHMVPIFPVTADLFIRLLKTLSDAGRWRTVTFALIAILLAILPITRQKRLWRTFTSIATWSYDAEAEIRKVMQQHPGKSIEMGYGADNASTYHWTFLKPIIVYAGNPHTIDGFSDMESYWSGIAMPPGKVRPIESCSTDLWLIPTGEVPFEMKNYYPGLKAFWPELRDTFQKNHIRIETGRYYDLWACRP